MTAREELEVVAAAAVRRAVLDGARAHELVEHAGQPCPDYRRRVVEAVARWLDVRVDFPPEKPE